MASKRPQSSSRNSNSNISRRSSTSNRNSSSNNVNQNRGNRNTSSKKDKQQKRKRKRIILISVLVSFILIISISGFFAFNFYKSYTIGGMSKNSVSDNLELATSIEIPSGSSLRDIANILENSEIIDNVNAFLLKCKTENLGNNIPAGTFNISLNNLTFYDLLDALYSPVVIDNGLRLLIKEGETQEDIATKLDSMGIVSYEDFMTTANTASFDYDFIDALPVSYERESRLEGYLYPDTYFLGEDETAYSIINKLLKRFDELYTDEMESKAKELGLTTDEIVTMASIIEKEIRYPAERTTAASVIYNRLEKGMKLQMDATVLYAKKEHSDRTTIADTQIISSYNTYYIEGLPIGPISNPSISCIEAVLNPDDTNYIYYVVENDETGQHFYTSSYTEFLSAKEKYLQKFD